MFSMAPEPWLQILRGRVLRICHAFPPFLSALLLLVGLREGHVADHVFLLWDQHVSKLQVCLFGATFQDLPDKKGSGSGGQGEVGAARVVNGFQPASRYMIALPRPLSWASQWTPEKLVSMALMALVHQSSGPWLVLTWSKKVSFWLVFHEVYQWRYCADLTEIMLALRKTYRERPREQRMCQV